jgi:hypothetical protein
MRILLLIFVLFFSSEMFAINQSDRMKATLSLKTSAGIPLRSLYHNTKILNVCPGQAPCENYVYTHYNGTIYYTAKEDGKPASIKMLFLKHHNLKITALGNSGNHIYLSTDSGNIYTLDISRFIIDHKASWIKMPEIIEGTVSVMTQARSNTTPIYLGTLSGGIYQNVDDKWKLLKKLDVGIATMQYDEVNKYLYVGTLQGFTYVHALNDPSNEFQYIYGATPNVDITSIAIIPTHNSVYAVNTNNELFKKDLVTSGSRGSDWKYLLTFQEAGRRSFLNATINEPSTEDKLLIGFDTGHVAWHDLRNPDEDDWNYMIHQSVYPMDGPVTSLVGTTDQTLRIPIGDLQTFTIHPEEIQPGKKIYTIKFENDGSYFIHRWSPDHGFLWDQF